MKHFLLLCTCCICINYCKAQVNPLIQKQTSLGGSKDDDARCIRQTTDMGFIITGGTASNDGDVTGNHGNFDCWVVKTNKSGAIEWQKTLGGTKSDYAHSIQQTKEGGYIVAGSTTSNDGDVSGNHGSSDYWIVKLNSTGTIEWQRCFGGTSGEDAYSIQQTKDDGYIVAGYAYSGDGNVSEHHSTGADAWILKLSSAGNIQWQKCVGGSDEDYAYSIQQTTDGGYVLAGRSSSTDGDISGNHGAADALIVKLDSTGSIQWQKSFGGSNDDYAVSIKQTFEGGYIVAASSYSNDGNVNTNKGQTDEWIMKLNKLGNIQWQQTFGGSLYDNALDILQTNEGGYIVAGSTTSVDGDITVNHGGSDFWLLKLNAAGMLQKQVSLGGSDYEEALSITSTSDGSYAVAGYSTSNNFDVSGHHGSSEFEDCWVVKLKPFNQTTVTASTVVSNAMQQNKALVILPNPSHNGVFTADIGAIKSNVFITVTDNNGKNVYTKKIASAQRIEIHLNNAAQGIYYLRLQYDGGMQNASLVIE